MYIRDGRRYEKPRNDAGNSNPTEIERERFDDDRLRGIIDWMKRVEAGGHYLFYEIKVPYILAQMRWMTGYCNRLRARLVELRAQKPTTLDGTKAKGGRNAIRAVSKG